MIYEIRTYTLPVLSKNLNESKVLPFGEYTGLFP